MYWICRRTSVLRARADGASSVSPRRMRARPVVVQPGDRPRRRRLARPRLPDDGQDLALLERQVDRVQHLDRAVVAHDVLEAQGRRLGLGRRELDGVAVLRLLVGDHLERLDAPRRVVGSDLQHVGDLCLALVDAQAAAWCEGAAVRTLARRGRVARDADQAAAPGQPRDRTDQATGVGVTRGLEQLVGRTELDDAAGVHHRDTGRHGRHHGQVVGHVERGHAVRSRKVAHGRQDRRLRRDVQTGRRLVEDDQAGPVGEGHREPDALLLTTRELMRVPLQVCRVVVEGHLAHHLRDASGVLVVVGLAVRLEHFAQLRPDPQRRVQRRRGVLWDVGDQRATQAPAARRRPWPGCPGRRA